MKCRDCYLLEKELQGHGIFLAPGINSVIELIRSLITAAADARRREDAMRKKLELHIKAHKADNEAKVR